MHGDDLSYAETFDAALQGLFGPGQAAEPGAPGALSMPQLGSDANAAFERYLSAQGEARFSDAADALSELQSLLSRLATQADGQPDDPKNPLQPSAAGDWCAAIGNAAVGAAPPPRPRSRSGRSGASPRPATSGSKAARAPTLIEIGIAIEIGAIGETSDDDPDPDPDLDWARSCCAQKT